MSDAILIAVLNVTRIVGFVIRPIIALLDVIRHLLLRIKKWQRKKLTLRALSAALSFCIFFSIPPLLGRDLRGRWSSQRTQLFTFAALWFGSAMSGP